jgi:two-component system sensor kinase FixL
MICYVGATQGPPEGTAAGIPAAAFGPVQRLHRRSLGSLAAIALLLLLNQLLVQPQFLALAIDPPTINRAGRQRMLSQRLAKAALAVDRAARDDGRRYLRELEEVRAAWSASHDRLREALDVPSSRAWGSGSIRAAFRELEPSFARLQGASARLIQVYSSPRADRAAGRAAVAEILAHEAIYLRRMDRIVGLYEGRARARIARLLWTGRALTGLVLVVLIGLGLFVLRPAAGIIRRQIAELQRARDTLEGKVRERTRALEEANRRLVAEGERRSAAEARHRAALEAAGHASRASTLGEMASGLAHELNQPLGAIANYAEGCLVELERDAPDLDALRETHRKLLATTLRAGAVVKRVRRFVTRRPLDPGPFGAARLLAEVAEIMADEARRRGITLRVGAVSDLPLAWGDPVQIQQVLINLVRNACEAIDASETSARQVVLAAERPSPGTVQFRVTDDGEGIAAEQLGRVFDPYFSTRAEGMGMGLAISRTIVEAHQGTLAVESRPGAGTTFRFSLPAAGAGDDGGTDGLRR